MNFGFLQNISMSQPPSLPLAASAQIYMHLSWAIVVAVLLLWLLRITLGRRLAFLQWLLPGGALLWSVVAGLSAPNWVSVSAAYWLGLAFQAPSLLTTGLLLWLGGLLLRGQSPGLALQTSAARWWCAWGLALGWVLMLDTFAVLPFEFYALGFGTVALAGAGLCLALFFVLFVATTRLRVRVKPLVILPGAVLVLFALLRLPTGNLWDALIDPWLWAVLHLMALRSLRASKATPA